MADTPLWTLQDAVEHLLDLHEQPRAAARTYRLAVRAVDTAYRDLPFRTRWSYFERQRLITTDASISTGTLTYDHSGGSSERLVTLSSAIVPEDVYLYRLMVGDVHYDIAGYLSSTTFQLSPNNNPGTDIAAGTGYTLYRAVYPLPNDFRKLSRIYDTDNKHELSVSTSDQMQFDSIWYSSPDTPWRVAIRGSPEHYGGMALVFGPAPSSARTYEILYEAAGRPLNIEKYSTGTVAVTAGQTSVTGTSTVFPADCVGSIIRFSADGTTEPTSKFGGVGDIANRYTAQRVITARSSDTALSIDATVSSSLSGVKYTISDPLDIEAGAMFTAFLRMAEAEYARLSRLPQDVRVESEAAAHRAIRLAMEADQRATYAHGHQVPYNRFTRTNITTES